MSARPKIKAVPPTKVTRFWTIRMDRQGRYDVVPVRFERRQDDDCFYRVDLPPDGQNPGDSIVVDIPLTQVYKTEKLALLACIRRCQDAVTSWQDRIATLLVRLGNTD